MGIACGQVVLLLALVIASPWDIWALAFPPPGFLNRNGASDPVTFIPSHDGRIVAIGDLHGDLTKAIRALELAGVLEMQGEEIAAAKWVGGNTLVVQMGDLCDRGPAELQTMLLLRWLAAQARLSGGDVITLNGNHDIMQATGDFRYVHPGAWQESTMLVDGLTPDMESNPGALRRLRQLLWQPGGALAQELAINPTVLVVADTVFVHGGLTPDHVQAGLESVNQEVSRWLRGDNVPAPTWLLSDKGPFWNRIYSGLGPGWQEQEACATLEETLELVSRSWPSDMPGPRVRRIVMGHTPQVDPSTFRVLGINAACDDKAWRIDIGMSRGMFDASPEVLVISTGNTALFDKQTVVVLGSKDIVDGLVL